MKKVLICLIITIHLFCSKTFAQCGIGFSTLDNGSKQFLARNEEIFTNKRFDLGIQTAYIQLEVQKHPTNSELMLFRALVTTANKGSFPTIIPRTLEIRFATGESLNLIAESSDNPRYVEGVKVFTSTFHLGIDNFAKIAKNSISSIKVADNRTGENLLNTSIYKDLLREQAMCLANAVKN